VDVPVSDTGLPGGSTRKMLHIPASECAWTWQWYIQSLGSETSPAIT